MNVFSQESKHRDLFSQCVNEVKDYLSDEPFTEFKKSMYFHRYLQVRSPNITKDSVFLPANICIVLKFVQKYDDCLIFLKNFVTFFIFFELLRFFQLLNLADGRL